MRLGAAGLLGLLVLFAVASSAAAQTAPLSLVIQFSRTGTYYVRLRVWASRSGDASVHVGLNGQIVDTADRIRVQRKHRRWKWTNTTLDEASRATIHIPEAGLHRINLWMREDGPVVDRLLLTSEAGYRPDDTGPAESPIVGTGAGAAAWEGPGALPETGAVLPEAFGLEGNYPNPFNPQTTIRYALPEAAFVRLAAYDVPGREVKLLVDGEQGAGRYEASFEGSGLPSGLYFYELRAGAFRQIRPMMLLK